MKQKVIKQLMMLLLIAVLSRAWLSATFFPIATMSAPNYSCSAKSDLYLDQDNDADLIPDYFLYLRSNFRLPVQNPPAYHAVLLSGNTTNALNATKVYYFASDDNVLSKKDFWSTNYTPMDNSTFYKASWVFPYNQRVRGIDTNNIRVNFERPLITWASNTVSIIYSYKYSQAVGYRFAHPPTPKYRYNIVASGNDFHWLTTTDYLEWTTDERRRSPLLSLETCKNYQMHRCGDGEIDTYSSTGKWINDWFTGEVCDDGELNGQAGYCNETCTGTWAGGFFCGDEIINDGSSETVVLSWNGLYYGPTYLSGTDEMFETCDDGNDPNDPDGMYNLDSETMFCSSICFDNFTEAFVEVFINE